MPMSFRWIVLLVADFTFFWLATKSKREMLVLVLTIVISYAFAILLNKKKSKLLLSVAIFVSAFPLLLDRILAFTGDRFTSVKASLILPLGLAFYTMQIIAYIVDSYNGKITPQHNIFKYALFISFFPQIIQGPIHRYEQLSSQLIEGHSFKEKNFMRGIQLILWGMFLKMMIADRAGVVVDTIFNGYKAYKGLFILIAGTLYSIQLYTDFLSCVTLSKGMSELLGIEIIDNFNHPYFADSVKDFWRRWHISLSSWLKDYVYIPLGGNRKGKVFKYVNLLITFLVSGLWHGGGIKYIFWGVMHGIYQIVEDCIPIFRRKHTGSRKVIRVGFNCFIVMLAWIIFRAQSLKIGLKMLKSMFSTFNPWIFFNGSIYTLGLVAREWGVLVISIGVLIFVNKKQEDGIVWRDSFEQAPLIVRWSIYIGIIVTIWVIGSYGYGYDAKDFIYGGF